MQWILLILAGIFEVTWAIAMKSSNGFTVLLPSAITVIGYILSAVFLFNEKLSVPQVICVGLIVIGIVGLKLLAKE